MMKLPATGPRNYLRWCGLTYRHAIAMLFDHFGYAQSLARKYGDLVPFKIFHRTCYLISDPELIHETLVHRAKQVSKQKRNVQFIERVLSRGMLTVQGKEWFRDRVAIQSLVRSDRLPTFAANATQNTREEIERWSSDEEVNIQPILGRILIRTVAQSLFDREPDSPDAWFAATVALSDRQMQEVLQPFSFPDWLPLPAQRRKRRAKQTMERAAKYLLRPNNGDCSPLYAALQKSFGEQLDGLDDVALSETMTFIIAGAHTTSAATEWVLYEIAKHPEIQTAARREARAANFCDATGTFDLESLPYIHQVISEALRIHPPVWALIGREAAEDFQLAGQRIKKGSWLFIYPKIVHRDARWFPNPERFDPNRFAPGAVAPINPKAYFPFGIGPHRCIGATAAETIMPSILATILRDFRLEPIGQLDNIRERDSTVMYPRGGVTVRPITGVSDLQETRNVSPAF